MHLHQIIMRFLIFKKLESIASVNNLLLGFCCLALFFCLMFDFFLINAAHLSFLFTNQSSSFQLLLPSNERKKSPDELRTRFSFDVYY